MTPEDVLAKLGNRRNPRLLLSRQEAGKEELAAIPEAWWELLSLDEVNLDGLTDLWQPVAGRLPQLMEELKNTVLGLAIFLEEGMPPSLLYIFKGQDGGGLLLRQGFPPLDKKGLDEDLAAIYDKLPAEARKLYAIHDGWSLLASQSSGHLPSTSWSLLSWPEWMLEKHIVAAMSVPPERCALLYSDGSSRYLGYALPEGKGKAKAIVFDEGKLREGVDFFEEYDEWTSAKFHDYAERGME
jgi:hypothetical protein